MPIPSLNREVGVHECLGCGGFVETWQDQVACEEQHMFEELVRAGIRDWTWLNPDKRPWINRNR